MQARYLGDLVDVAVCGKRSMRAITPSLTPTMHIIHARCYKASEFVGGSLHCRRGIVVILWMPLLGESFHA